MSAIGAALARAVGSLGGPTMAGGIVVGGIVVGALGGGFIAASSGGSQPATSAGRLAVYACPDSGEPLLMVQGGQKLLATGRTEDGAWLRIHFPDPGRSEAWVQATPVQVQGAMDSLPVAECLPELAVAPPSVEPAQSFTVAANNPPSAPPAEVPTATPAPTQTPVPTPTAVANRKPTLSSLTVSTRKISYDTDDYCPNAETRVTFRVKAGDDDGVTGVTLFWREPGAGSFARAAMSRSAGSAASGTWQVTLDTTANGITKAGKLAYYAVATDADGATRRIPTGGSSSITVDVCANTGPTIKSASSSAGSTLFWDPLGAPGNCQTATNITASVKDVDGIRSVSLFYRRPGASWQSKPMNDQTIAGKWYANLDTLGDKITIVDPPTDTLRWYIKAIDDKGKASQTSTRDITIRRCDTEAQFDGVFPRNPNNLYPCDTTATITIGTYANDADQPNDGLKVVFHWSLFNPRTKDGPITGKVTATTQRGNYYQGVTRNFDGNRFYYAQLTVYAVTTDRYGGTTKSPVDGDIMQCPN